MSLSESTLTHWWIVTLDRRTLHILDRHIDRIHTIAHTPQPDIPGKGSPINSGHTFRQISIG